MRRGVGIALGVALLPALVGCQPGGQTVSRLPNAQGMNVIVVSFDALRADALGIYGAGDDRTPRIDAWARDAVVFDRAYSVAPVTPTSFAAAFSGQLPTRSFVGWHFVAERTLAGAFSENGYSTAAFANNVQLAPERFFGRDFGLYDWRRNDDDSDLVTEITGWLERDRPPEPMFLWVHLLRPHAPYLPRPGAGHLYDSNDSGPFAQGSGSSFHPENDAELERLRSLYASEVWYADHLFGRLLDTFDRVGLLESSVVILTADHGEEFGEHGGFQHGRLYEEHLRIPLVLSHPGLSAGRRVPSIARNVDLLPTLLELIGGQDAGGDDGRSLADLDAAAPAPVVAISMTGATKRSASILRDEIKTIVHCAPTSVELFDLSEDPGETTDLSGNRQETVADELVALASALGGPPCEVMAAAAQGNVVTTGLEDTDSLEALRALGYIE